MYIFELITKFFAKKKNIESYNPVEPEDNLVEDSQDCEHFFMPLDASGEYFACRNCGLVVPKDKLN